MRFWNGKEEFSSGSREHAPLLFLGLSTKDICNYACIFCYGPEFRRTDDGKPLSSEEQKDLIDQAIELGIRSVLYCGNGEPTIDMDLTGMVEHAHLKGLSNVIFTNGHALGSDEEAQKHHGMDSLELAQFLVANNSSVVMHVESMQPELYERITRREGSYAGMRHALENIQMAGFTNVSTNRGGKQVTRFAITSLAMKWNFFELPELREYAHSINAQYLCKFPSFLGDLKEHEDTFFVPSEDSTLWLRENYVRRLSAKPESITVDGVHCGGWHYGIVVQNNGDIRFCYSAKCDPANWVGNVREQQLATLVDGRERQYVDALRKGEVCPVKAQWYKLLQNERQRAK